MRHIFFRIVLAAAAIALQTSIAFACTCAPKRPVLDEYEWAQVVMIARIASVEKAAKADKTDHDYGVRSSRLVVEKVYKGDVRVGEELVFAQGNGMNCQMRFSEETIGDQILLYEGRPPAGTPWSASFCGRSTGVKSATEDLLYLDKLDQVRGKTRVSGKYTGGFYGRELKVAGRKIRIVSEADSYETTTDDKGIFEIYGLPPGNYRLEPELDPGVNLDPSWIGFSGFSPDQLSDTSVAFTLKARRHVSIELGFKSKDQKWGGEARPK